MNDSIMALLKDLIALLRDPSVKSKQAAFNACYSQLSQAKEIASWETIVTIIKEETDIKFDAKTASNMFGRIKRHNKPKVTLDTETSSRIDKNPKRETIDSAHDNLDVAKWQNINVNTSRLIADLEVNGFTPDEVKSWDLPNDSAIRKKLTQLLNKRG
ncbi:hypothetical protein CWM94_00055 [Klebsiella pneumoniae]|nr:hypothetical protein CWM94_00055 [Klebsiella pneumoniae]